MSSVDPPVILTNRFEAALVFANQLHRQQMRKGSSVPYMSHLLSVAALVLEDGGSEDEAIAALHHDAEEDQGGSATRNAIGQQFGSIVCNIVDGCTEISAVPQPSWQERKEAYLSNLCQASSAIVRVSLADKLHNARSILADYNRHGSAIWQRFKTGKAGTLWFYTSFLDIVRNKTQSPMVVELENIVIVLRSQHP